jgi:hypothetical protein
MEGHSLSVYKIFIKMEEFVVWRKRASGRRNELHDYMVDTDLEAH